MSGWGSQHVPRITGFCNGEDDGVAQPAREQRGHVIHASGVARPDGGHFDHLPVEPLHAVALVQDALFGHPVVLVHREAAGDEGCGHGDPPDGWVRLRAGSMPRMLRRGGQRSLNG